MYMRRDWHQGIHAYIYVQVILGMSTVSLQLLHVNLPQSICREQTNNKERRGDQTSVFVIQWMLRMKNRMDSSWLTLSYNLIIY